MRTTVSILLLVAAVGVGILVPAAGYCELWLRNAGSLRFELGACGREPNLDDAYWVIADSVFPLAGVLFLGSLIGLLWGPAGRYRLRTWR